MKKIEVSDEIYTRLIEISKEMKSQDNRYTASPFFYQIRTTKEVPVPEGCGEEKWIDEDGVEVSKEEMEEQLVENRNMSYDSKVEFNNLTDAEKEYEYEEEGFRKVWFNYDYNYENCFFTESAANSHLKVNKHNYIEPVTYVNHAYRNPEMEFLHKFLFNLTE